MHEVTLAATTYKKHKNIDHQIAQMLLSGFTRNIKGWWDNCVSQDDKTRILIVVKLEPSST